MTTHEQRLSALERTQIANNEQFTMLLGVIGEQGQDIKRMLMSWSNTQTYWSTILSHWIAILKA